MSTAESISNLFNLDVHNINIGKAPPESGATFYVKASQGFETGNRGNSMVSDHQAVGETIGECLNKITEQVKAAHALKKEGSPIVTLPKARN